MNEYIKTLLDQVRCRKAHAYIEEEIRDHIEEQIKTNISEGMTEKEAIENAVKDMGNPVETGIALDQIHRPAMAWDMILLTALISLAGCAVHISIGSDIYGSNRFVIHTIMGFLAMLLTYRLDYSFLAKYAKIIAIGMLGFVILSIFFSGGMVNGVVYYLAFPGLSFTRVSIFAFMMLYVPVYAAVIYQYYGTGMSGIIKALAWMIIPVLLAMSLPNLSLAIILFFSMAIVLSLAVYKGWFKISRKLFFSAFIGVIFLLPLVILLGGIRFQLFEEYQTARLYAFLSNGGEENYLTNILRTQLEASRFVGGNGRNIMEELPEFNSSFIFNFITSSYGMIAGMLLCAALTFLIVKIFMISVHQKNQLGMLIGCGCGTVLFINIAINIMQNVGALPVSQSFLPFFSYGGSFIIVSYIMLGIILSIYRYKNIFPIHFRKCKNDELFN